MSEDARAACIAAVQREIAEMERLDAAVEASLARRHARGNVSSVVFSIRLDPDELAALEARAESLGLRPTVLARNLLRIGLARRTDEAVSEAIGRVAAAVDELRELVA